MMKKTSIARLIEKKNDTSSPKNQHPFYECKFLCNSFLKEEELTQVEYFFYIVSYITNVEAFFRSFLCRFLEQSPEHLRNISNILEEKLSKKELIECILALNSKKISAGEILSSTIQISSKDQIMLYLDAITNKTAIEKMKDLSSSENFKEEFKSETAVFNFENSFNSLQNLFTIRHILCHENSLYSNFSKIQLDEDFFNTTGLLGLILRLLNSLMGIPNFTCEADRRQFINQEVQKFNLVLEETHEKITNQFKQHEDSIFNDSPDFPKGKLQKDFSKSVKAWNEFIHADSIAFSNQLYGGTAQAEQYSKNLGLLIMQRIENLNSHWLEPSNRDISPPPVNRFPYY